MPSKGSGRCASKAWRREVRPPLRGAPAGDLPAAHFWSRDIEATDLAGNRVGLYEPRGLRRGGTLHWAGRQLILRPASRWRERYALADGDTEVAIFDGKGWGRTPVSLSIDETATVEPGLLLFAAFIVRRLAEDANTAAGAAATTAATG